jgi:hypothetical protein
LGKTYAELMTGQPGPLSAWELTHWKALINVEALERLVS